MTYTIEERREIYWQVYFILQDYEYAIQRGWGICCILMKTGIGMWSETDVRLLFPEIYAQRPRKAKDYWWPHTIKGWESRCKAVLRAIELTYK